MTNLVKDTKSEGSTLLDNLLDDISISSEVESRDETKLGLAALLSEIVKNQDNTEKLDKSLVDSLIASIDEKLSDQMDEIIHNQDFQKLESAWRGLKFTIDRTDFRENIRIDMMNVSKVDMLDDFEDAAELFESGLYKKIYTQEYGQFGGEPYGAVIANYEFSHATPDVKLLQSAAAVGAISHAPFIAAVSPKMFGIDDITQLSTINDLDALFEQKIYTKWNSFRDTEDAKYIGLTSPKFLLREPFDPTESPVKTFNYKESVSQHNDYSWGNSAFAMATRLTESFAKYRWCPNIIGPTSGGAVEDLPIHNYESMGEIQTAVPTETLISDRREFEMAEYGFIPLAYRKGSDNAAFFSANSLQKVKSFGISEEGKAQELNQRLGTQLPYMFIICRVAHYIKVLQREQLGSWKDAGDLTRELNDWLSQYVANQDNPTPEIRSRKPLRSASVAVTDVPGNAGWYSVEINIRPHFKYQGADITLSLVGRLDDQK
jgi:type VI secretion system protein ImpC